VEASSLQRMYCECHRRKVDIYSSNMFDSVQITARIDRGLRHLCLWPDRGSTATAIHVPGEFSAPSWTSLYLTPSNVFREDVKMNLPSRLNSPYLLGQFLEEMDGLMGRVSERWNEISHYLKELLSEDSTFLEGDKYVELLFEDET
jgi:hypothetical protein